MFSPGTALLVFLALIKITVQATDDGIPPVLTILIADVELPEKEDARIGLGKVASCVDGDGDPIRAYIESILPTSGCGLKCLQLEPVNNQPSMFKLMFQPTDGFGTTPSYTLTIACTDDEEAVVEKTMSVTIVSNTPPTFKPSNPAYASVDIHGQKTTHDENYELYEVKTEEPDKDAVFYTMATEPITDLIEIEYASGQIRAAQDLRLLCEQKVEASVTARDPYNPAIGPFTVDINIDKNNVRPSITNLDTTVTVDEDLGVGKTFLTLNVEDGKLSDFTFNQLSPTSAGMESYALTDDRLKTRVPLSYEREDQRSTKLYFSVNDGYCSSDKVYTLNVELNDVPEEPVLTPLDMFVEVFEGEINTPSNVFVLDDDLNEVHTFSKTGGDDEFDVDPDNGNIVSVGEVTLKKNKKYKDYSLKMQVTDKDGLTNGKNYIAKIRVWDANTNRPYFTHQTVPLRLSALDCTPPGASLGRLKGDDDDSSYNLNDWYYFGGGGEKFAVAANGRVALTEYCLDGESYSGTATIADLGIVPGPLTGADTLEIILDCGPCPPGGYPGDAEDEDAEDTTTATPDSSNATEAAVAVAVEETPSGEGLDLAETLTWFIPAVLAGAIWMAVTAFFIYRFCAPVQLGNPISTPSVTKVTPQPPKPLPPKPAPAPPPKPANPPPPPAPRTVSPSEPYLYDFWKETYTNQDQTQHPNRTARPTAIENMPAAQSNLPPQNLRLGPPGAYGSYNAPPSLPGAGNTPAPEAAPKGKSCAIL